MCQRFSLVAASLLTAVMLFAVAPASAAPPVISIDQPVEGSFHRTDVPPLGVTDDGTSVTLDCRFDAQAWVDCVTDLSTLTSQTLPEGEHAFSVRGENAANEVTTVFATFTIDRTAPVATIDAAPATTNDDTPNFTFSASDAHPGATTCRIYLFGSTAPAFSACTTPTSFASPALADGSWVFQIAHTDAAGNVGFDGVTIAVDTAAPILTITSPLPNQVMMTSIPELGLSFDDPAPGTGVFTAQCAFDADALVLCGDETFSNRRLADGPHTLHVRVTDGAGNVTEQTIPFSVDTSLGPPEATTLKLKRMSKKAVRGKLRLRVRLTVGLAPSVDPAVACNGRVRLRVKGKLRGKRTRTFTKRVALKRSGSTCVATGSFALPIAYKRKKLTGEAYLAGNAALAPSRVKSRL